MALIFFRTAIVYILLSVSMRMMGKREIGELDVGELVATLLISEICSIPIDDPNIPLLNALIPALFIVSLEIIVSSVKNKSSKLKRLIDGEPVYLIKKGLLNQRALIENRISIEEFLCAVRQTGIADLSEISYCVLEANGKISVIKSGEGEFNHIIISDGEENQKNLHALGYSRDWLLEKLDGRAIGEVFLLTVDDTGSTTIILKDRK